MMWWLPLAAAANHHHAELDGDTVVWVSELDSPKRDGCAPLARPFSGELLPPARIDSEGRVCSGRPGSTATIRSVQAFPGDRLDFPIAAGSQRVVLHGARFEPQHDLGLQKGLNAWWTPGFGTKERRAIDRDADGPVRLASGTRLFISPTDRVVADGLLGTLRGPGPQWVAKAGAGGVFLAMMLGLGLGYRKLERYARRERVDAWLAENDDLTSSS